MIPSAIAPWKLSASLFIRAEKVTYFPPCAGRRAAFAVLTQLSPLGDLRRAPHVRRQDATRKLAPLAVGVHPAVVHAGRTHRDRPRADGDVSGPPLAVADH